MIVWDIIEYLWKSNTPLLYDLIAAHSHPNNISTIDCHSISVNSLTSNIQIYMNSNTSRNPSNYLLKANIIIPNTLEATHSTFNPSKISKLTDIKLNITNKYSSDIINRIKILPNYHNIIATISSSPDIIIHLSSDNINDDSIYSNCILTGNDHGGKALSWNRNKQGQLLSGSYDSKIFLYDINHYISNNQELIDEICHISNYIHDINHYSSINDIEWDITSFNIFYSVGDDGRLCTWDTRQEYSVNSISCSCNENLIATSSNDKLIKLFDKRQINRSLYHLSGHQSEVNMIKFNPIFPNILASSSNDCKIFLWDLFRINSLQSPKEVSEGPPELLFIHGGHTKPILDFVWNMNTDTRTVQAHPWFIASLSSDNIIQFWEMAQSIQI